MAHTYRFRLLRLALVWLVLFGVAPTQFAYAADPNVPIVAEGLRSFGRAFAGLDALGSLAAPLPLTALHPGGAEGLRLSDIFRESLSDRLTGTYDSLDALKTAIEQPAEPYDGVQVSYENVAIQQNGTQIDVLFTVRARRAVAAALVVDQPPIRLNGGAQTINLELTSDLAFQLNLVDRHLGRDFYLVGAPIMQVHTTTSGPINPFEDQVGVASVDVSGTFNLDTTTAIGLRDPDRDGRITQEEWETTALSDLAQVAIIDGPGDAVNALLRLEATPVPGSTAELIPGTPDGLITLTDDTLADGLAKPDLTQLGAIRAFTTLDPVDMLLGLNQFTAALQTAMVSTAPQLPLFRDPLFRDLDALAPLDTLLHYYGDAAILCGSEPTDPPTGALDRLPPHARVFCQALAMRNPTQVEWTIDEATNLERATGAEAIRTVGINPDTSVSFEPPQGGHPDITLTFTDAAGLHTVRPLFRTVQELFAALNAIGDGLTVAPDDMRFDPATASLSYRIRVQRDPTPYEAHLAVGDQLRAASGLTNLVPAGGIGPGLDVGPLQFDATFGMILLPNLADISEATDTADRFFIAALGTKPELTLDAAVRAPALQLAGSLGPLAVTVAGDPTAGSSGNTAIQLARTDPARPMFRLDLEPPAGGIMLTGHPAIPDGVQVTRVFSHTADFVRAEVNVSAAAALMATATIDDGKTQLAQAPITIRWADITHSNQISADPSEPFTNTMRVFDIVPGHPEALPSLFVSGLAHALDRMLAQAARPEQARVLPLLGLDVARVLRRGVALDGPIDDLTQHAPRSLQELETRLEAWTPAPSVREQAVRNDEPQTEPAGADVSFRLLPLAPGSPTSAPQLVMTIRFARSFSESFQLQLPIGNGPAIVSRGSLTGTITGTGEISLGVPLVATTDPATLPAPLIYDTSVLAAEALVADPNVELDAGAGPLHLVVGKAVGQNAVGVLHVGVRASLGIQQPSNQALSLDEFAHALGVQIGSNGLPNASCGSFPDPAGTTVELTGAACARLDLGLQAGDAVVRLGQLGMRVEDLAVAPDELGDPDNWYVSAPDLSRLIDDPANKLDWALLLDALRGLPNVLHGLRESGQSLPLVGEALDTGADVAKTFEDTVLQPLSQIEPALVGANNANDVRNRIEQVLATLPQPVAPAAASVAPMVSDATVKVFCGEPTECTTEQLPSITDVRISYTWRPIFEQKDISLAARLSDLVRTDGGLTATTAVIVPLTFGLSRQHGPYLMIEDRPLVSLAGDVAITTNATRCKDGESYNPETGPESLRHFAIDRCLHGDVGFLKVTLRDSDRPEGRTGLNFGANLRLPAGDDRFVSVAELPQAIAQMQPAIDRATANIHLRFRTAVDETGSLPAILGTIDWRILNQDDSSAPALGNLYVDVGDIAKQLVQPIARQVKTITSPLRPVADAVYAPIPGLSEARRAFEDKDVRLADLLPSDSNVVLLERLLKLSRLADWTPGWGNNRPDLIPIPLPSQANALAAGAVLISSDAADPVVRLNEALRELHEEYGLSIPFLEHPAQIVDLIYGKDIDLMHFDAPPLDASAGLSYEFRLLPTPIKVTFGGRIGVRGHLALGYTTRGLHEGRTILDGLYLDDLYNGEDVPELALYGRITVAASLDIVVAEAGVEGGITFTAGLNLSDRLAQGGRLYGDAVIANLGNPFCLFDLSGQLSADLSAYARVGIGWFSTTWHYPIASVTLIDFEQELCSPDQLTLAHVEGTTLILHIGVDTTLPDQLRESLKDEHFVVRQLSPEGQGKDKDQIGTWLAVDAFGAHEEHFVPAGGPVRVLARDAGDGDDSISLEPGVAPDGAIITATVRAEFNGGLGNDRLSGGMGNDQLTGGDGDDQLLGRSGQDELIGGDGDDQLDGAADNDTLEGGGGADVLGGGAGSDRLDGGAGNDDLRGGSIAPTESDTLIGGAENDRLEGSAGNDRLFGDNEVQIDPVDPCVHEDSGPGGDDVLLAGTGSDVLIGGVGKDRLEGGAGDDKLCGGVDADILYGDTTPEVGADSTGSGADHLDGGADGDRLFGGAGADDLFGRAGDDFLYGEEGDDNLSGGLGIDRLEGGADRDYLFGDDGSAVRPAGQVDATSVNFSETIGDVDALFGGEGGDVLYGEGGDDRMSGDVGQDEMYGNAGRDIMRGGTENDTMQGNADDDSMYGDSGDDRMFGNAGNDTMRGGIGDDYTEGNAGADTIFGDADQDDLIGGTAARGAADADDTLDGGAQSDYLAGDNALIARPGGVTTFDGTAIRRVTLLDIDSPDSTLSGGDHMFGGDGNDRMWGQGSDDEEHGGAGDDFMQGNAAADTMYGDAGQDDILGGSDASGRNDGADIIHGGNGQSDLASDFDVIAGDNAVILRPLTFGKWRTNYFDGSIQRQVTLLDEVFVGGAENGAVGGGDAIDGDGGDDLIFGQGGDDTLRGGAGDDSVEGNSGADTVFGGAGQDDLIGGSAAPGRLDAGDTLYGGDGQSNLTNDHDMIAGDNAAIARPLLCGQWQLNRFDGSVVRNVTLFEVATVGQTVVVRGDDQIFGESGDDQVYGQGGDDILDGGAGDDTLQGNADADMIAGGTGDDDLVGGTGRINGDGPQGTTGRADGRDTIDGGAGFDTIAGDNAILARTLFDKKQTPACPPNTAIGAPLSVGGVWRQNSYNSGIQHEDRILLDAGSPDSAAVAGEDTLSGGDDDDLLYGQAGDDTLSGGAGDDTIEGNAGSDTIDGGDGSDDIVGGSAQAGSVDEASDYIQGDAGDDAIAGDNALITRPLDGHDQWKRDPRSGAVQRQVKLYDVQLKGKRVDPRLSSWDSLDGGAGHDMLLGQGGDDLLIGGEGEDYMEGNAGADLMYGDAGKDRMIGGGSGGDGVVGSGKKLKDLVDGTDTIDGGADGATIIQDNGVIR